MTNNKRDSKSKSKTGWDPNFDEHLGIAPRQTDNKPDKRSTIEIESPSVDADTADNTPIGEDTAATGGDLLIVHDKAQDDTPTAFTEGQPDGEDDADAANEIVTKHLRREGDPDDPMHGLGAARFDGLLEIEVQETGVRFAFPYDEFTAIALGRRDNRTGIIPEVDLTPHGGGEKGVSRQHARIVREKASLYLVDQKSVNGTFLNGQELMPENPRMLRDGDDIRLGDLTLRVHFYSKQAIARLRRM